MSKKQSAINTIEEKKALICEVADRIWEYAELSLREYKSCNLYCEVLAKEGFAVEKGICDIPTAFSASFGSGSPRIGILAEYDALSGLSQERAVTEERPAGQNGSGYSSENTPLDGEVEGKDRLAGQGESGHGCGHNLLGAGAMAAAIGIKKYIEEGGKGTVILYGCPGEEGCASKAFMARDGVWNDLDCALTWHPADCNEVVTGSSNSCIQYLYTFHGIASHASNAPEMGRSALDAVELMNIGVQFLREHMDNRARIHYAITDAGGVSPNVVQSRAQVLYMVRSNYVRDALELQKRVDRIAEGAALMTETRCEKKFVDGLSDTVTNRTLEEVLYRNFEEQELPDYTEDELKFAKELSLTYEGRDITPGIGSAEDPLYAADVREIVKKDNPLNPILLPAYKGNAFNPGSTDVGDVSQNTPTVQIHVTAWPNGCPAHSWQSVSSAGSSIGHKAAILAGKVLCGAAIDLIESPETLKKAREEFDKRTALGYICPIPEGAKAEV